MGDGGDLLIGRSPPSPPLPDGNRRALVLVAGINDIHHLKERHLNLLAGNPYYFIQFVVSRIEAIHE